jgi:hypothetical protein
VLLAYVFIALAIVADNGSFNGLPFMVAAVVVLHRVLRRGERAPRRGHVALLFAAFAASAWWRAAQFYFTRGEPSWPLVAVTLAQCGLGALVCLRPRVPARLALGASLVLFAILGAAAIHRTAVPRIDVFHLQQDGARALLAGRNPYAIPTFPNPYGADETRAYFGDARPSLSEYPYPPLSLVATPLGFAAGGDVRYALLAAQLGIAILLFVVARRSGQPPWFALALPIAHLANPRGAFVLEQSWTDALPALCFVGVLSVRSFFAGPRDRRPAAPGELGTALWLGLLLAVKQYGVILLPLLLHRRGPRLCTLALALLIAAAVTLPLFLWDPRAFVDDVLLFQLRQPFRPDSLSLAALVARTVGWRAPGALALIAAAAAIALGWRRIAGPRTFALVSALTFAWFFLTAKQAFCNYYYFLGVMVLSAVAARDPSAEAVAPVEAQSA